MNENPYRAPTARVVEALRPSSPWAEPFRRCFFRWALICGVNSLLGFALGLTMFDRPLDVAGILFVIATFVILMASIDYWLRRVGWKFLNDSLYIGAIMKALLQLVLFVDLALGAGALEVVKQTVGYVPFVTPALTTLVFAAGASATALVIGIGLNGLVSISTLARRRYENDLGFVHGRG